MPPKKKPPKPKDGEEESTRIAIVNAEKCKPKKCNQECKKSCPVVKLGKLCIEVTPKSKLAFISEPLCIGKTVCFVLRLPVQNRRQSYHICQRRVLTTMLLLSALFLQVVVFA